MNISENIIFNGSIKDHSYGKGEWHSTECEIIWMNYQGCSKPFFCLGQKCNGDTAPSKLEIKYTSASPLRSVLDLRNSHYKNRFMSSNLNGYSKNFGKNIVAAGPHGLKKPGEKRGLPSSNQS